MNEIEPNTSGQTAGSSDMLKALENLEQMFQVCRFCTNEVARHSVRMGIAAEAQTMALKMKTMLARWNRYLPFHEVMDVKFDYWMQRVAEWIDALDYDAPEELKAKYAHVDPCYEHMLDLYAQTDHTDGEGNQVVRDPHFYTVGDHTDDYRQQVSAYMERMDELLARSTEEAIKAMHKALGIGTALGDPNLEKLSQELWSLLKKRRNCNEDKSLKVIWLNMVGYWKSKGLISGTSPTLAKHFFPFCGEKDYTAIDKDYNQRNRNFLSIIPLLDACFDTKR